MSLPLCVHDDVNVTLSEADDFASAGGSSFTAADRGGQSEKARTTVIPDSNSIHPHSLLRQKLAAAQSFNQSPASSTNAHLKS